MTGTAVFAVMALLRSWDTRPTTNSRVPCTSVSTPYEATGRSAQKKRTRDALVAATRDLLADGVTPTVEDAAATASISRTTAYRYFPNQRALLVAAHPEVAAASML